MSSESETVVQFPLGKRFAGSYVDQGDRIKNLHRRLREIDEAIKSLRGLRVQIKEVYIAACLALRDAAPN